MPKHKLQFLPKRKSITWVSHTYCNYSCSYCIPELYNGKYRWQNDYSKVIDFVKEFREDYQLKFDIMGGEPTLWPKFTDFCKDLCATGAEGDTFITFSTNASRTLRYWETFDAPVSEVVISYHPETADYLHIEKVIEVLYAKGYNIVLYLMCPVHLFKKIKKIFQYFKTKNTPAMMFIKTVADWTGEGNIQEYSSKQIKFLSTVKWNGKYIKQSQSELFLDGRSVEVRKLINSKKNSFTGWKCAAGIDYVGIEANGDIYGSQCKAFGKIGNIYSKYTLPKRMGICKKRWCSCGSDIEINKVKK